MYISLNEFYYEIGLKPDGIQGTILAGILKMAG